MGVQKRVNLKILIILSIFSLFYSHISYVNAVNKCTATPSKSCHNFISNFLNKTQNQNSQKSVDANIDIPQSPLFFEQYHHILNFTTNIEISTECRDSVRRLEELAKKFDFTALKILDATAKIGSGLMNGNLNQYGDFDMCLEAKSKDLRGKFCLADIHFHVHKSLEHYRTLLMASEMYSNTFNSPFHITPKNSNILWGVCMPSNCSHNDFEIVMNRTIERNFGKYLKSIQLKVNEKSCQMAENESHTSVLSLGTKITLGLFILILLVSCLSTIYDLITSENVNKNRNDLILTFSMKKNFNEIMSTDMNEKEIRTLNGIRFINTILIMVSHKCMTIHYQLIANRTQVSKTYGGTFSVPLRGAYLNTEVFLMLSGLLTTYSLIGRLQRGEKIGIIREITTRYLRYMPVIVVLILFYSYVFPILGNGPIWPILIGTQSEICKAYSWRNILMIHNWFDFRDMCMFHSHHVGTDFTLFTISIFFIIKLHNYPRYNTMVFLFIAIMSSVARFYVTYLQNIIVYVRLGASIDKLIEASNKMYAIPPYRFTCYIMGIFMGYALRNKMSVALTPRILKFGWFVSTIGLFISAVISIMNNYGDDPLWSALFTAVAPLTLCVFFAWIIYASHCGTKSKNRAKVYVLIFSLFCTLSCVLLVDIVASFFEWKYFKITTSLSYGVYLVQFVIFSFNAGVSRAPFVYSYYDNMFDLNEILLVFAAALVLTLFIELPFENLRKKIFDTKNTSHSSKSKTN